MTLFEQTNKIVKRICLRPCHSKRNWRCLSVILVEVIIKILVIKKENSTFDFCLIAKRHVISIVHSWRILCLFRKNQFERIVKDLNNNIVSEIIVLNGPELVMLIGYFSRCLIIIFSGCLRFVIKKGKPILILSWFSLSLMWGNMTAFSSPMMKINTGWLLLSKNSSVSLFNSDSSYDISKTFETLFLSNAW